MNDFYVYALLDPREVSLWVYGNGKLCFAYKPFYIGKGRGRRCYEHVREALRRKGRVNRRQGLIRSLVSQGYEPKIVKLHTRCSEKRAYELEAKYIRIIGRFVEGGPLTNHSTGGGVDSGWKHTEQWKLEQSKRKRGRPLGAEFGRKISMAKKGMEFTDCHKKALVLAKKGHMTDVEYEEYVKQRDHRRSKEEVAEIKSTNGQRIWAKRSVEERNTRVSALHAARDRPEVRAKIRASIQKRNAEVPQVQCPHCQKVGQEYAMKRWHFDNCRRI